MKRRPLLKLAAGAAAGAIAAPYVIAQSKKFARITLRINGYGGSNLAHAVASSAWRYPRLNYPMLDP